MLKTLSLVDDVVSVETNLNEDATGILKMCNACVTRSRSD